MRPLRQTHPGRHLQEGHGRMNDAMEAGLCGADNGQGGCVYLPHPTGPHSWQTATVTTIHDNLSTPDGDAA